MVVVTSIGRNGLHALITPWQQLQLLQRHLHAGSERAALFMGREEEACAWVQTRRGQWRSDVATPAACENAGQLGDDLVVYCNTAEGCSFRNYKEGI
nr:unnamed protein product [Digitaria exilis]